MTCQLYELFTLELGDDVANPGEVGLLLQISRVGGAVQEGEEHPIRGVQHRLLAQVLFGEGFALKNYPLLLEPGLYHKRHLWGSEIGLVLTHDDPGPCIVAFVQFELQPRSRQIALVDRAVLRLALVGLSGPQAALVVHYQNRDTAPLELINAVPKEVYYHRPLESITFEGHPQAVEGGHPDPQLIHRLQDQGEHIRKPKPGGPQVMEIIGHLDTHSLGYALCPGSLLFGVHLEVHIEAGGLLVDGISEPFFLRRGYRHAHVECDGALGDTPLPVDAGWEAFGKDALDDRRAGAHIFWEAAEFLHPKCARFFIITIHP